MKHTIKRRNYAELLEAVVFCLEGKSLSNYNIHRQTGLSPSTTKNIINGLRGIGFVTSQRVDKKETRHTLTNRGNQFLKELVRIRAEWADFYALISDREEP